MKYWIMLNGVQLGPLEEDDARRLPLTAETPVWAEGFSDWLPAGKVDVFAPMFQQSSQHYNRFAGNYNAGGAYRQQQASYAPGSNFGEIPPEPPTYLAWSILATLFCCIPLGIVAIIYSAGVSGAYNRGDYAGALSRSNNARNWIIASIVLGLISYGLWALVFWPVSLVSALI